MEDKKGCVVKIQVGDVWTVRAFHIPLKAVQDLISSGSFSTLEKCMLAYPTSLEFGYSSQEAVENGEITARPYIDGIVEFEVEPSLKKEIHEGHVNRSKEPEQEIAETDEISIPFIGADCGLRGNYKA